MINKPHFAWDIIGHEKVVSYLQYFIVNSKLHHAYLFYGHENIGKKRLAKNFIQNILCYENAKKNNFECTQFPCHACDHCRSIEKNIHSDIIWIGQEYDNKTKKLRKNISIDQIRNLKKTIYQAPFLKSYKFAVIPDLQIMSESAYNSILKILEEPPEKTIIILIANNIAAVPKTILSRCQMIQLHPVSNRTIKDYLLKQKILLKKADDISSLSQGKPEIALNLLNNQQLMNEHLNNVNLLLQILESKNHFKIKIIDGLSKTYKDSAEQQNFINQQIKVWTQVLRDILLIQLGQQELISHKMIYDNLSILSSKISRTSIINLLSRLKEFEQMMKLNINQKLALENIFLNIN